MDQMDGMDRKIEKKGKENRDRFNRKNRFPLCRHTPLNFKRVPVKHRYEKRKKRF